MSLYRTIQSHIKDFQYKLYTTLPATVTKYDPVECTVDVQPAITELDIDGLIRVLPFLERVPLMFSTSKDSSITFPVKVGDYVLLHFCQSEIDNLLVQNKANQQEFVDPRSPRKHTINDCFATIGVRVYEDSPVKRPDTLDMYFKDSRFTIYEDGKMQMVSGTTGSSVTIEANGDIDIFSSGNLSISSVGVTTISGGQVVIQK